MTEPMTSLSAAATLILLRERDAGGPPALLLLERARHMAFGAGASVFPGGRIEPADLVHAARFAPDLSPYEGAARVAALRETFEESGIALGAPAIASEEVAAARQALTGGADFLEVARALGWQIDLDALFPYGRWIPPADVSRRFDTRFYLATLPADAPGALADGIETVALAWTTAAAALDAAATGRRSLLFPTRRMLERLAQFNSIAAIESDARRFPIEAIVPQVEERPEGRFLCIPAGLGYPVTEEPIGSARRS